MDDEDFFPKDAIGFFLALSTVYVGLWIWIYMAIVIHD